MEDGCEAGSPPSLREPSPRISDESDAPPVFVSPEEVLAAEPSRGKAGTGTEGDLARDWVQAEPPAPASLPRPAAGSSAQDLGFSMLYDHGTVNHGAEGAGAQRHRGKLRKGPGAALSSVLRRRPSTIVPDDAVTECMNCHKEFHLGLRRHHCRWCVAPASAPPRFAVALPTHFLTSCPAGRCLRVFCYNCCSGRAVLPIDGVGAMADAVRIDDAYLNGWKQKAENWLYGNDWEAQRVCTECDAQLSALELVRKTCEALSLVRLELPELWRCGGVCSKWNQAANWILSQIREVRHCSDENELPLVLRVFFHARP